MISNDCRGRLATPAASSPTVNGRPAAGTAVPATQVFPAAGRLAMRRSTPGSLLSGALICGALLAGLMGALPAQAAGGLTLRQEIVVPSQDVRIEDQNGFDVISLRGGAVSGPDGSPALPVLPVTLRIPAGMRVTGVSAQVLETDALTGRYRIERIRSVSSDGRPNPADQLPMLLDDTGFYPREIATVGVTGRMRGRTLGSVIVAPFRYRETDGHLEVARRIELSIQLEADPRDHRLDFLPMRQEPWAEATLGLTAERLAMNGTVTPEAFALGERNGRQPLKPMINSGAPFAPTFRPSVDGSPVEYVIITDDAQAAVYQQLADWKTRAGTPTVVRTISWIKANYANGVDTQETIRNFIRDAASKWGTIWVLLGGDSPVIPVRYGFTQFFGGEEIPTDLYYQCLDGNWNQDGDAIFGEGYGSSIQVGDDCDLYPDVYLGRMTTNNAAEAQIVINKLLAYSRNPPRSGYQRDFIALAEVLFPQTYSPGDSILFDGADVAETAIAFLPGNFRKVKLYENCPNPRWPTCIKERKSTVIDSLNAGFGFVHHVGHGYINTMAVGENDQTLTNADADAFHNGPENFFLYAINCTSAAVDFSCIAERFLLNPNGGSVGSVGSTRFDFPSTGWAYQDEFYRLMFQQGYTEIGRAADGSKLPFVPLAAQDNTHRWTQFTEILIGDPSMSVWTDAPYDLTVSVPTTFTLGGAPVNVTVTRSGSPVDSAIVCFNKANDDYVSVMTNAAGQASLPFAPDSTGSYMITVNARNAVPYQSSGNVVAPASAYLYAQDQLITDNGTGTSIGNGDQKVDAGETIELKLPLKNRGSGTGAATTATLSTSNPYLTVLDATSTYGLIGGGNTVTPGDAMTIRVARNAPDRTEALLQMTYQSGATNIQEDVILYIHAPLFSWHRMFARDSVGTGNNNGIIENNETVALRCQLRNEGLGQAVSLIGKLRSTDPVFTISDSTISFGTVNGGTRLIATPADAFAFSMSDTTGLTAGLHLLTVTLYDTYSPNTPVATFPIEPKGPVQLPTGFVAAGSTSSIALTFVGVTDPGTKGYNIYRSLASGGPFARINQYVTDRSSYYNDEGLPALTVFYYKVAAQDSSGNEGPLSVVASASTTVPLHSGFPVEVKSPTNGSVTIADLDYNGDLEIVAGAQEIYALQPDGTEFFNGDDDVRTLGILTNTNGPGYWNSPAVGDMNKDGSPEIAAVSWTGSLYLWDNHGVVKPGFPRNVNILNQVDINPLGSVAMADLDNDGQMELVCLSGKILYAFHADGTEVIDGDANPATLGVFKLTNTAYCYGTPALADLNGDGRPEIIAGMRDGKLHVFQATTSALELPGFPFTTAGNITSSPAVCDLDNNGQPDIVFGASDSKMYALKKDGTAVAGWPQGIQLNEDFDSSPAVGDITGDGIPDVVVGASNGRLFAWRNTGAILPGFPLFVRDNLNNNVPVRSSPILVDIDNDGLPEIIVGDQIGRLFAFKANGTPVPGFPIQTGNLIEGGPAAWDLDGDGLTEIVAESFDGKIYQWDTPWTFNKNASPWPMFHHDPRHTGRLAEPLFYQTAVGEGIEPQKMPFTLLQNQPNPFNPVTRIRYRIEEAASRGGTLSVRLEIYNSTGRLVKTLVDRPLPAGEYEVGWDGSDVNGGHAASGIYYYRLTTPEGSQSRKMLMVK